MTTLSPTGCLVAYIFKSALSVIFWDCGVRLCVYSRQRYYMHFSLPASAVMEGWGRFCFGPGKTGNNISPASIDEAPSWESVCLYFFSRQQLAWGKVDPKIMMLCSWWNGLDLTAQFSAPRVAFSSVFFRFNFQLMDILSSHNNPFVADRLAANWSHFCMKSPRTPKTPWRSSVNLFLVENVDGAFLMRTLWGRNLGVTVMCFNKETSTPLC